MASIPSASDDCDDPAIQTGTICVGWDADHTECSPLDTLDNFGTCQRCQKPTDGVRVTRKKK